MIDGARRYMHMQQRASGESLSGPGSSFAVTRPVRDWLPNALRRLDCTSLADIPCGDHHWLSTVDLPCQYIGYDILPELIESNRVQYYWREFQVLDCVTQQPEPCNAILCRDLLVHLSLSDALKALENFQASGASWLLATTFPQTLQNIERSESHAGWGWRPLNMEREPFNLGESVDGVEETEAGKWSKVYRL